MIPFFLIVFVVYGAFHAYAFRKIDGVLHLAPGSQVFLVLFFVLMILAPFLVRAAERYGFSFLARVFAYSGYTWMGIIFLFTCISLVIDLARVLVFLSGLVVHRDLLALLPSPGRILALSVLLCLSIAVYGWFEARNVRMETLTIKTSRIPATPGRIRIVQITDVHLGVMVGEDRLQKITELVRQANPDILVSTGDLVDGQSDELERCMESLGKIEPRYGKFAVTGNHEFYAGLDRSLALTRGAGFTVLRGQGMAVGGLVNIAGMDDPAIGDPRTSGGEQEEAALSGLSSTGFTILLKHRPLLSRAIDKFDLQLSGHTHKGQIFPFNFVTHLFFPRQGGFFRLSVHSSLYSSRGTGTWGPPIRFLSPPEITVIDLVHAG